MTFYLIRIPLFVFFPVIWLTGYLVEKPKLQKFGKVGTIISGIVAAVLLGYFALFKKVSRQ
ncbi:hypothetical protein MCERE19_01095 [Spirosomataceae bacterium]